MADRFVLSNLIMILGLFLSLTSSPGMASDAGKGLSSAHGVDRLVEQAPPQQAGDPMATIREFLQNTPQLVETGSITLTRAIRHSRDLALETSRPIPREIRELLAPYFNREILDKARYTTEWGTSSEVTLYQLLFAGAYAWAVTLDNVIIFYHERHVNNLRIWAHELKHVEQYDRWGIETFSKKYILDSRSVEQEAFDYADYVVRKIGRWILPAL